MMTSAPVKQVTFPAGSQLELDGLELLPCGCVIAIQHADPWPVRAISLEAKGPYCPLGWHRPGRVLRLGDPADEFEGIADDFDPDEEMVAAAR